MGLWDTLTKFEEWAAAHKSAAVLRDHVAIFRDQLQLQEKELNAVRKQLVDALQRIAELEQEKARQQRELEGLRTAHEYTHARGALFRKLPSGEWDETVYCPSCKEAMFSAHKVMNYRCRACDKWADFTGITVHEVVSALAGRSGG